MYYYSCSDGEYTYTIESEQPLNEPCNGIGKEVDGNGNTTKDNILPSIPGGFLLFGLGNIFPPFLADAIKKILAIMALIIAALIVLYLLKRRK